MLVGILFTIFYKLKIIPHGINSSYLSVENTNSVKAICAIGVVMYHITSEVDCGNAFYIFRIIGYLMVSVFFFYSGYGLIYSLNKKPNYLKKFFTGRICKVLIPYILAVIIYTIVKSLYNNGLNLKRFWMAI